MPQFGERSRRHRDTCHPKLIILLDEAIKIYDFAVLCGHRGKADQEEAFAAGLSQLRWPDSKHNNPTSMAFDAAPWHSKRPNIRWKSEKEFATLHGVFVAVAARHDIKLCWGGDWDRDFDQYDQTFNDLGHWELVLS